MKADNKQTKQDSQAVMAIILPDDFSVDWQTVQERMDIPQVHIQQDLWQLFLDHPDQALYDLAFADRSILLTPSIQYLAQVSRTFISQIALRPEREFLREALLVILAPEAAAGLVSQAPYMNGSEYLDLDWIGRTGRRIMSVYAAEIKEYTGTVAEYLSERHAAVQSAGRVFFHLVESKQMDMPFAFMATYAGGVDQSGQANHLPLANALREYRSDRNKLLSLLSTVTRAADESIFIKDLMDSGEIFQPIGLEADEAYVFLKEIPLYEASGIICRMPDWWKKRTSAARVSVTIGNKSPSRVGFDALVDFNVSIALGDLQLTEEDLRRLLAETEGLVLIKGRWIEVDHDRLQAVLKAYEDARKKAGSTGMNLIDAMRMQLQTAKDQADATTGAVIEINHGSWLQSFLSQMASASVTEAVSCGDRFLATLRPYQEQGLAWLHLMKSLGLGACLADDMGLGKTVQVIALLNGIRTCRSEKNLLVVPASLIGNWRKEVERFAPNLSFGVLHPSEYLPEPDDATTLPEQTDLLVTTYGMLNRYEWLKKTHWDTLILDEAQAIKNPSTRQTRAVKQVKADFRVALTGTPIENRLSDLWSLFDFLNQGLLGSAKEFAGFSKKLQEQQSDYARLKTVLSPFILRRLKTDRAIIRDLPDKIEMKTYAGLSKKQVALYSSLVEELQYKLMQNGDGIERKGLILASILKFKQICNHPDQFLGQYQYHETESGKFARLKEICETIYEKRERVLVFTQFREMTEPLQAFLKGVFAHKGLVLHGGTPVVKRKQIVDTFQGATYVPFLVLSIKAGGVGLNLTAANHVIHFDRWWNPAVENQATDRAFRIGQQKNVVVHKFITSGTIEEKIDQMIEDKSSLARSIIPEKQEAWITEMDNQQLMNLFRLSL
ncbi:MAG: DEAD/DEAH box helicase [Bacillota bacterium]|nr:DEAD/DEAH box helicase [Bacillota bacterium]